MKKGHFLFSVISFSAILPLLVFLSLCSLAEGEGLPKIQTSIEHLQNGSLLHCWLTTELEELQFLSFFEKGFPHWDDIPPISLEKGQNITIFLSISDVTKYGDYKCCLQDISCDDSTIVECSSSITFASTDAGEPVDIYLLHNASHSVECNGNLTLFHLANGFITTIEQTPYVITLTSLDEQAKLLCFDNETVSITYILADYDPIRYISPECNGTILPAQEPGLSLTLRCEATGRPDPDVHWLDDWYSYPEYSNDWRERTDLPNGEELHIKVLQNHIFEIYWIYCMASNVWEDRKRWIKYPDPPEQITTTVSTVQNKTVYVVEEFSVDPRVFSTTDETRISIKCKVNSTVNPQRFLYIQDAELRKNCTFETTLFGENGITGIVNSASLQSCGGIWLCIYAISPSNVLATSALTVAAVDGDILKILEESASTVTIDFNADPYNIKNVSLYLYASNYTLDKNKLVIKEIYSGDAHFVLPVLFLSMSKTYDAESEIIKYSLYYSVNKTSLKFTKNISEGIIQWNVSYYQANVIHKTTVIFIPMSEPQDPESYIVIVAVAIVAFVFSILVLLTVFLGAFLMQKRIRKKKLAKEIEQYDSIPFNQRLLMKFEQELEGSGLLYPIDTLKMTGTVGEGAFGVVKKAILYKSENISRTVAVKTAKATDEGSTEEFIREFKMLRRVGNHTNIINLVGATVKDDQLYILVEYADKGSLLSVLRKKRHTGERLPWREGCNYALQIARGMAHLASKQCVHCDLAARNILVTGDGVLKVSDFGLARKMYYEVYHKKVTTKTKLPLKWLAVECLECQEFTTHSDVWAFGVLLWEIATMGGSPYPGMNPQDIMAKLKSGYRMPKPSGCPVNIYTIMLSCWLPSVTQRPSFPQLVAMLQLLYGDFGNITCDDLLPGVIEQSEADYSDSSGSTIQNGEFCQQFDQGSSGTGTVSPGSGEFTCNTKMYWISGQTSQCCYLNDCKHNHFTDSSGVCKNFTTESEDCRCTSSFGEELHLSPQYRNVTIRSGSGNSRHPLKQLMRMDSNICPNGTGSTATSEFTGSSGPYLTT